MIHIYTYMEFCFPTIICNGLYSCTPPYVLCKTVFDAFQVDIWSMGTILFLMLMGQRLYKDPTDSNFRMIMDGRIDEVIEKMEKQRRFALPYVAKDLIKCMLKPDPRDRISVEKVFDHAWMNMGNFDDMDPAEE